MSSEEIDMWVVFTCDTGHWWSRFIREDMGHDVPGQDQDKCIDEITEDDMMLKFCVST